MKNILIIGGNGGIGSEIVKLLTDESTVINLSRTNLSLPNIDDYNCDVLEDDLPVLERLDSIIYCPGTINLKPLSSLTLDDFLNDYKTNVLGAVKVIKHYLPLLKKSDTASILLFSTVATKLGMPFHASVAASKSAVEGLVKSLAAEFAPTIRVNAIAPTLTNTKLASGILRNERMVNKMIERHPLKRILQPRDVAEMASFLVSEKAQAMTGQIINIDAGLVSVKS